MKHVLASFLPFEHRVSLRPMHTFGIDVYADNLLRIWDEASLQLFVEANAHLNHPIFVLSGGSNVLFQGNPQSLILKIEIKGREILSQQKDHVLLRLGAGENWHETVLYCIAQGWGGIENLSLIPGNVGAAPIQNIGAYGVEIADVFEYLEAIHIQSGALRKFSKEECKFGYRNSIFKLDEKGKYVITRVVLRLTHRMHELRTSYGAIKGELQNRGIVHPHISDISDIVCKIRQSKLPNPSNLGNAGSFFKNPIIPAKEFEQIQSDFPDIPFYPEPKNHYKIPAAWLIQTCGWKGQRFGNFGVYDKQALVLVNYGGASGEEIFSLSERILQSVKVKFGIKLEREVQVI
ncbi:MAG: UDP-N-acetylmuramate dehydrogenase [Bacteroidota bacterium]